MKRLFLPVALALLLVALAFAVLPQGQARPAYAAPLLARTVITPTGVTSAGITQTLAAAEADGNNFTNNGATWVAVVNGYTDTTTATFVTPRTIDGLAVADKAVAIPAGSTWLIGPFGTNTYNQSDGTTWIDFSQVTSVTLAAFYLD